MMEAMLEEMVAYYVRKKEFQEFVKNAFPLLSKFKKYEERKGFQALLSKTLPEVKTYIQRRLETVMLKRQILKGKYRTNVFIERLDKEAYNRFKEVKNRDELHPWLFKKAEELLKDTVVQEEFEAVFYKNIPNYSKADWQKMQESFKKIMKIEVLGIGKTDDVDFPEKNFLLKNIFLIDGGDIIIKLLDCRANENDIKTHTKMVLHHFPLPMRTVFELFTKHQFDIEAIAKIKNLTINQVELLLHDARKGLERSFYSRYFNDYELKQTHYGYQKS